MVSKNTQDKLDIFKGAFEQGKLDWGTFLHLEQDQRPDAIEYLMHMGILSKQKEGNFGLEAQIRGINPAAANLTHGPDNEPVYFTSRYYGQQVLNYYKQNNQRATLTQY